MNRAVQGVIIVLGSPNDAEGRLSSIALERCAQALAEFERHPGYAVLPTGGWGDHFNVTDTPHGDYVRQELLTGGIPNAAFLPCVESSNTVEDATLSRPILDAYPGADLIIVTSDFHEARARFVFEREFAGRAIILSTCVTDLPPDELARRRAHEERALQGLKNRGTAPRSEPASKSAPGAGPEADHARGTHGEDVAQDLAQ